MAECGTPAIPCWSAPAVDDTIDEALSYYRTVVGDRTPAELQETYVRGGSALIEYLEADEHFAFKILPWPDYYSSVPGARNDGMRHTVSKAVPDERLGRFQGQVRGPLDHERLGGPQPDLLTGGRAVVGRFLWAMADNPAVAAHLNTSLVELIVEDGRVTGGVVECDGSGARSGRVAESCWPRADSSRTRRCGPNTAFPERHRERWVHPVIPAWRTRPRSPPVRAPT